MHNKDKQVTSSAERIDALGQTKRSEGGEKQPSTEGRPHAARVGGIHLSPMRLNKLKPKVIPQEINKLRPANKEIHLKKLEAISIKGASLPEEENRLFYKVALGTHKCCWNKELHLFNLMKIFCEGHAPLKKVSKWKIPQLDAKSPFWQNGVKSTKNLKREHSCIRISIKTTDEKKRKDEEREMIERLDLEKRQKETRNYSQRPPLFS